jgi:hypothetical protein
VAFSSVVGGLSLATGGHNTLSVPMVECGILPQPQSYQLQQEPLSPLHTDGGLIGLSNSSSRLVGVAGGRTIAPAYFDRLAPQRFLDPAQTQSFA